MAFVLQGRVAAQLTGGSDELILTELIFSGLFSALTPAVICALVSCTIARTRKSGARITVPQELESSFAALQGSAKRIARIAGDAGVIADEDDYVLSFQAEIAAPVMAWARGGRFVDVLKMCDTYEGALVRDIRRLSEVLSQVHVALKVVGESGLADQFEAAGTSLRRGVIFSPSLYL